MLKYNKKDLAVLRNSKITHKNSVIKGRFEYEFNLTLVHPMGISQKMRDYINKEFLKRGFELTLKKQLPFAGENIFSFVINTRATCSKSQKFEYKIGEKVVNIKAKMQIIKAIMAILDIITLYDEVISINKSFLWTNMNYFILREGSYIKSL